MIYSDIDQNIFVKIASKSDEDTINILCSGSISDYIDPLAKKDRVAFNFYSDYEQ